jgi:hypothetical protein
MQFPYLLNNGKTIDLAAIDPADLIDIPEDEALEILALLRGIVSAAQDVTE